MSGFPKMGHKQQRSNRGAIRSSFETYTRFYGFDDKGIKKLLNVFFSYLVGGGLSFLKILKVNVSKKVWKTLCYINEFKFF